MNRDLLILYIDALFYVLTSVYWIRKKKWNVGIMILLIMTISHIGAIFYYAVLSYLGLLVDNLAIEPPVYLFICILICIYPFLKYDEIRQIDVRGNVVFIKCLSLFIIFITIEPFLENVKILLTSHGDYSDAYEVSRDADVSVLEFLGFSAIGQKMNGWCSLFRIPAVVLFFFYFSQRRKMMTVGLGIAVLHHFLMGVSIGQRGVIVIMGLLCASCFILMSNIFSKTVIEKMRRWSLVLSIPFVLLFAGITISRYEAGSQQRSMIQWLLLYVSEGPIRFNNEMYYEEHNTNGDVNLNFAKSLLGLQTYTTYEERDEHYIAKNGRRIEVFYTFIGDFVSDFGIVGSVVICLLLSMTASNLLQGKNGAIPIDKFMIILFLSHLYVIGFASNVYRAYSLQKGVFIMLILCLMMFYNRQNFLNREQVKSA